MNGNGAGKISQARRQVDKIGMEDMETPVISTTFATR